MKEFQPDFYQNQENLCWQQMYKFINSKESNQLKRQKVYEKLWKIQGYETELIEKHNANDKKIKQDSETRDKLEEMEKRLK